MAVTGERGWERERERERARESERERERDGKREREKERDRDREKERERERSGRELVAAWSVFLRWAAPPPPSPNTQTLIPKVIPCVAIPRAPCVPQMPTQTVVMWGSGRRSGRALTNQIFMFAVQCSNTHSPTHTHTHTHTLSLPPSLSPSLSLDKGGQSKYFLDQCRRLVRT